MQLNIERQVNYLSAFIFDICAMQNVHVADISEKFDD